MDIIKTTKTLNLHYKFADDDTRVQSVDNPIEDHEELAEKIAAIETELKTNQVVVGDKTGAAFSEIEKAVVQTKKITQFDLD